MRFACPLCGDRDRREFTFGGAALTRPEGVAWSAAWDDYLHLRDNPAGPSREWWYHGAGCSAWLIIERDRVSHAVHSVALAAGGQS